MSTTLLLSGQKRAERRWSYQLRSRRALADHRILLVLLIATGVLFWFAVPYSLPWNPAADTLHAAASESEAFQGSVSRQVALPIVLLLSGCALLRLPARGRLSSRSRILAAAIAYVAWSLASLLWSTDPQTTRKRLIVLVVNGVFCFAVARLTTMRQLAVLGFVCTGAVALLALFADVVLLRSFAPADPNYRFTGVMTANYQAMNLFVCLVCGLTLMQSRPRLIGWLAPLLSLFAVLLFLTRARIGTILFLFAVSGVAWKLALEMREHTRALLIAGLLLLVIPGSWFLAGRFGLNALSSAFMMGRDDHENTASLSNRAPLWSELSQSIQERPFSGFGFEAFWTPERVEKISLDQGWVVPHAHNTYLDQTLSLGIPGVSLYAGCVWSACVVSWKRFRARCDAFTLLPALLLSWLVLLGLTESIPIAPYLPSLLAYSCVLKMCMSEVDQRAAEDGFAQRRSSPLLA